MTAISAVPLVLPCPPQPARAQRYAAAGGSELYGVREQVDDDLLDLALIQLETAISAACAQVLPDISTTSTSVRRHEIASAILDAGRAMLGDLDFVIFSGAVALEHWALPDEA